MERKFEGLRNWEGSPNGQCEEIDKAEPLTVNLSQTEEPHQNLSINLERTRNLSIFASTMSMHGAGRERDQVKQP